jgi:hypothetical protein
MTALLGGTGCPLLALMELLTDAAAWAPLNPARPSLPTTTSVVPRDFRVSSSAGAMVLFWYGACGDGGLLLLVSPDASLLTGGLLLLLLLLTGASTAVGKGGIGDP